MDYLKTTKSNILVSVIVAIICFIGLHQTDALKDAGMAAIILNWFPFIIGLFSIIIYLIFNFFTKKYAWIITVLGSLLNIVAVLSSAFNS